MSLSLRSVTYRYAGSSRRVLRSLDLSIERGEVLGVVGANDAGKSTLCLVAAGLAPTTIGGRLDGEVAIDGAPSAGARPHELAQRCGVLFQNPVTQLSGTTSTVWEEIAFGPRNLGLALEAIVERVAWALSLLNIDVLAPRDPARLSGGQAQLVALAAVLAMRPSYLVLDEPTSQLDPHGTELAGEALGRLAASSEDAGQEPRQEIRLRGMDVPLSRLTSGTPLPNAALTVDICLTPYRLMFARGHAPHVGLYMTAIAMLQRTFWPRDSRWLPMERL